MVLPRILPDDWKGGFVLLVMVFVLSRFLDNIAAALIGGTMASAVFRKKLRQWMFRITAYAERLLADLSTLDWPESTRIMQTEWIGRSEGAEVDFPIADRPSDSLRVYTTRPDTIFGATYMVIAPEHELVEQIL